MATPIKDPRSSMGKAGSDEIGGVLFSESFDKASAHFMRTLRFSPFLSALIMSEIALSIDFRNTSITLISYS